MKELSHAMDFMKYLDIKMKKNLNCMKGIRCIMDVIVDFMETAMCVQKRAMRLMQEGLATGIGFVLTVDEETLRQVVQATKDLSTSGNKLSKKQKKMKKYITRWTNYFQKYSKKKKAGKKGGDDDE